MRPVDAVLEILRSEGVSRVFGNPGTTELPLIEALSRQRELAYVLGLQEASVVAMADGYARATGRPAFVNLHVAAGLANGLIGLLNARRSRTPLVVTAGQQDQRHLLQDPMLAGDLVGLATPAVKSAVEVHQAYDLPLVLRRAFALARTPPTGPVFVSIPMDLLDAATSVEVPARSPISLPGAARDLSGAVEVLSAAARPVIVAGDGVGREGAVDALVRLASRLGATVYHQPMHDALDFPTTHPRYAGMLLPRHAAIRESLAPYDVMLLAGCHAFSPHHYTPGPPVPPELRIVQVDSDPTEIGRNFPVSVGLCGSLAQTLDALTSSLAGVAGGDPPTIARSTEEVPEGVSDLARALADGLPEHAILVEEAITVGLQLRCVVRMSRPGSYVHTVGGGLGWGIGAAIGTAMGAPERPVVAALGDGCAMFGLQGLWSAVRYGVPVTFVVFRNDQYRTLGDSLRERGSPGPHVGVDLAPPHIDWSSAARTFGMPYARIDDPAELTATIAACTDRTDPLLLEVPMG